MDSPDEKTSLLTWWALGLVAFLFLGALLLFYLAGRSQTLYSLMISDIVSTLEEPAFTKWVAEASEHPGDHPTLGSFVMFDRSGGYVFVLREIGWTSSPDSSEIGSFDFGQPYTTGNVIYSLASEKGFFGSWVVAKIPVQALPALPD
jgi:hypothetical protein